MRSMVAKRSANKAGKRTRKRTKLTARTADRHWLYQQSVQAPEVDSRFFARFYKRVVGRPARVFREDFCGTAVLACHWVLLHRENRAIGVDIDQKTLDWGRAHNVATLLDDRQRERLTLFCRNVLDVSEPRADIIAALNFSYSVFKTRDELRAYFANARDALERDGLLLVDAWGGSETQVEQEERRPQAGFTYVWDQHRFDPVSHRSTCKIHFEFKDGTRIRNAFVYDWRMWTLPELQELMVEAGLRNIQVLWECTDRETDEGNGVFRKVTRGDADLSWIAYVVGQR
jgi:SAM-dependent methyltransferase